MITATNRHSVINARSDMTSRALSFLIITPIFLMTGYRWIIEAMFQNGINMSNIGWIAINCSGIIVLILGSVFMRGHNNRNALFVEALSPAFFWSLYLNVGSYLVNIGFHYIAVLLGPALFSVSLFYLVYRVRIETKLLFWFGKYIAPLTGNRKARYQDYAIRSVKSKGVTNFQLMLIGLYSINTMLWALSAGALLFAGIAEQVPFFLQTDVQEEKLSYIAREFYGFDVSSLLLGQVFDWVNTIFAAGMIYFVFTDYVSPDQIGGNKRGVPNHVGHGARELVL